MMVAGVVIMSGSIRIGVFVSIPSLMLLIAGVILLLQNKINRNWGWLPIAVGIVIMLFTSNFSASANMLAILVSSSLLFVGHQFFTTGKILNYNLDSIKQIFNTKRH